MRASVLLPLLLAAALSAGTVHAQSADAAKPTWGELSAAQKSALQPLSAEWDKLDAARKQKWLEIGNRFAAMGPDEQQRLHERMRAWLAMTPEQRRQARENYTLSKQVDKSQKSAKWDEYQQLSDEEKKKLAAGAAKKNPVTNLPPKAEANSRPAPATPPSTAKPNPTPNAK